MSPFLLGVDSWISGQLVALKKAKEKKITQAQAAEELAISER